MSRLGPGRRTAAILAIVLLIAVAGSDLLIAGFWLSHPMLTAIVSALVVVVLSVAVIEVVLSRRAERRWRVLAQTALMELAEAANNTTWSTLAEVLELPGASEMPPDRVRAAKPHGTINWFALLDREMLSVDKRSNLWVVGPNIGSYMCYKISPLDPVDFTKTSVEYVLS